MMKPPGKSFCLTIPRLKYRQEKFRKDWKHIDFEFFEGVDYQNLNFLFKEIDRLGLVPDKDEYIWQIAITVSHYKLLEHCLRLNYSGPFTIFEDDAETFEDNWITEDYDLVRWYSHELEWCGTCCYSITKEAIKEMLDRKNIRGIDYLFFDMGFTQLSLSKPVTRTTIDCSYPVF